MRLGFWCARCDNGGLGIQSIDHFKHLSPSKVTLITGVAGYEDFPERFPGASIIKGLPTEQDIDEFLKDIDIALLFETPYSPLFYQKARERGVKTILQTNYEWLETYDRPDMYQVVSDWHSENIPGLSYRLPCPVDRGKFKFKLREKADTFLHVAGHPETTYGRNGTQILLDAIPLVKADVKFIIYAQPDKRVEKDYDIPNDPRIDLRRGDFPDSSVFFEEGDVYVYPRLYGGQSLILNEALSCGLPVMMTDMKPQNEYLPKELLIHPDSFKPIKVRQPFNMAVLDHARLAKKIDEIAHQNIIDLSRKSNEIAELWSWETNLPKFREMFDLVYMVNSPQVLCE